MQDFINVFCNAHFEKPLGKIAVFIAGSIIATCGAFLIGSSISYAAFPPEKSATTTHKNYRKQCLIRGLIGALMGCGLTYAGIIAIIKSDRFFA